MNATANTTNLTDGMRLTVEALKKNGIDTIFGVVGIPVTDLARYAQKEGIRYIGFRHEQSASNAAAASGFITGRPGILLTVSAPGFLNGLGALANATVNGFPMIQISGSSDRAIIDLEQGDYEGLDQLNIARPFAKAAYRVNRPEDICTGLVRAVRAAVSGRPGGVYLDLTTAMLAAELDRDTAAASLFSPVDPAPAVIPSADAVERALKLLSAAEKPLVILGKGAAYAQADRRERYITEEQSSGKLLSLEQMEEDALLPDYVGAETAPSAETEALEREDLRNLAEQKQILLLALLSLKDTDRELINALFFDGASTRECAQRMGVSQRAVIKRRDRILRDLKGWVVLVPLMIIVGTFLGGVAAWTMLDMSFRDVMAVAAGFGYYSLSSMLINQLADVSLGSMALISNMVRELVTLLFAPLFARVFGGLGPLSAAGAASDTCLPAIIRTSGERNTILGIFSGMVLTIAVPIFVTSIFAWL